MFKLIKHLKQELFFIPIMLLVVELARKVIVHYYPETALFDRGSELETFLFRLWQMTWVTSACWLLMAVVFPPGYKALVKFYNDFDGMLASEKRTYATRIFLVFFFGLIMLLSGRASTPTRSRLFDTLNMQLHVRELTGHNDGTDVEKYLRFVGRQKGDAWCAAFTSFNYAAVGITRPINPVSAWAPSFSNPDYVIYSQAKVKAHKAIEPQIGDCFTLYYDHLGRVGHVGFIVGRSGNYFITIEGNTGLTGSREGSGVHKLKRARDKVFTVSDYITPYEKTIHAACDCNSCSAVTAQLLLSKGDRGIKHERKNRTRQFKYRQRQYVVPGHLAEAARGNKPAARNGAGGSKRVTPDGHPLCGDPEVQSNSFSKKRQAQRRLRMQGHGAATENKEQVGYCLQKSGRSEATRKGHFTDEGGPVYPLVG